MTHKNSHQCFSIEKNVWQSKTKTNIKKRSQNIITLIPMKCRVLFFSIHLLYIFGIALASCLNCVQTYFGIILLKNFIHSSHFYSSITFLFASWERALPCVCIAHFVLFVLNELTTINEAPTNEQIARRRSLPRANGRSGRGNKMFHFRLYLNDPRVVCSLLVILFFCRFCAFVLVYSAWFILSFFVDRYSVLSRRSFEKIRCAVQRKKYKIRN